MRVNFVKKARKDQGTCRCGHEIVAGEAYKWAKGRYGPRMVRCDNCHFRSSELTGSDKLSRVYEAQENCEEALDGFETPDDVEALLEEFAEAVREVANEYQESADNIRDSFPESPTADECEEKSSELESWADEAEGIDHDFDEDNVEFDEDEVDTSDCDDEDERKECIEEAKAEAVEKAKAEWKENVQAEIEGMLGNCPV